MITLFIDAEIVAIFAMCAIVLRAVFNNWEDSE